MLHFITATNRRQRMTTRELSRALQAEFVIQFRAGMSVASDDALVDFLDRELLRFKTAFDTVQPNVLWAYYNKRTLRFERNKAYAEDCADGFIWDNPRVRKVAIVYPESAPTCRPTS